jgi:hypothetical protein
MTGSGYVYFVWDGEAIKNGTDQAICWSKIITLIGNENVGRYRRTQAYGKNASPQICTS